MAGIVPTVGGIWYAYSVARSGLFRETTVLIQADADTVAARINEAVDVARAEVVHVAEQAQRARDARSKPRWEAAAAVLSTWGERAPVPLDTLTVIDSAGDVLFGYALHRPGADLRVNPDHERTLTAQAASTGKVVFGGLVPGPDVERAAFAFAAPMPGGDGTVLSSLYGSIPVEWVARSLNARSVEGGSVWVFDDAGRVVLATADRADGAETARALAAQTASANQGVVRVQAGRTAWVGSSRPLGEFGARAPWTAVVAVPEAVIAAKINIWQYVGLAAAAVLVLLGFAWLVSARIMRPISTLEDGTRRIAQGDVDFQVQINARNELDRLAGSVHQMAYDLKRAQERLIKAERLAAIGEARIEISQELEGAAARLEGQVKRLQARPDLPAAAREPLGEIGEALAGIHASIQKLAHVPDRTSETVIRPRMPEAPSPSTEPRVEGVA
ncbi:MAG TPA: HAMP domain-containing protein [Nitrospiria bacterium]|nr:HAMP domain-containing protein [Nitrospiria bacterium]